MTSRICSGVRVSLNGGMSLPPFSIQARRLSSVIFSPPENFSLLPRPLKPGPTFFSVLAARWHMAQYVLYTDWPALTLTALALPFVGGFFSLVDLPGPWPASGITRTERRAQSEA